MRKLLLISLFSILSVIMFSNTITVTNTQNLGFGSLRDAVSISLIGDTIRFNPSLISSGNAAIYLTSAITVNKQLVFKGLYNNTDTLIISGSNTTSIFSFGANQRVVLDSMVLINGYSTTPGGAVKIESVDSVFILNSVFKDCKSGNRGAGFNFNTGKYNSYFLVKNTSFINNKTQWLGGAFYIFNGGYLDFNMENSRVLNNWANYDGGGMFFYILSDTANIKIRDSDISYNETVSNNAGGIGVDAFSYNKTVNVEFINSQLTHNRAKYGSGGAVSIVNEGANIDLFIDSSKLNNNFSKINGGAIMLDCEKSLKITVNNSEFDSDTSGNSGSAIYTFARTDSAVVKIIKSTVSNNRSPSSAGVFSRGVKKSIVDISLSTFTKNITSGNAGATIMLSCSPCNPVDQGTCIVNIEKSTIYQNTATSQYGTGGIYMSPNSTNSLFTISNSILSDNFPMNYVMGAYTHTSQGYNAFSDNFTSGYLPTDIIGADSSVIFLDNLKYNGGFAKTISPKIISPLINRGQPTDMTEAQNGNIRDTRRDIGACERSAMPHVGIIENDKMSFYTAFPNPNNGTFTLQFDKEQEITSLFITDINGRLIKEITPQKTLNYEINFEGASGIYFLNVVNENERRILKLVKE